jgi:hypothetical protein
MNTTLLTVLSFSGGKQSSAILWMVLLGKIQIDKNNFLVLNADPGMENSFTYKYVEMMKGKCLDAGIEFVTVDGPNLYEDMINLKNTDKTRFDTPPYWTLSSTGSVGRLMQGCTQIYKIAPMDRELRRQLKCRYGISDKSKRLGNEIVEKWIGFSYSELERIKPPKQKYIRFSYPLIDLKMSNKDVIQFFVDNNLSLPPRSVCNACFANGLDTFREMYQNRPRDWNQAINVDKSVRDWSQIGVRDRVFVSNTCIALEDLSQKDFDITKIKGDLENDYSCDSGYCFL